jgi:RNA polymerase sigma-70 factor (family 1)
LKLSEDHTDADLVSALGNGDRHAFELIYRKHVSDLYRYARNNISDKQDCEEIIQEVFESLWARRANLRIQVSLRAYLLGIVRYKIIHHFRKRALKRKYEEHFLFFEAVYDQIEGEGINHEAIQSTLAKLITELPERCQEALKLRLTEELSNRDIAKRMNITTLTLETYMFRAFNHIRASYGGHVGHV